MFLQSTVRLALLVSTALTAASPALAQSAAPADAPPAVDCPPGQPCLQPDGAITLDTVTIGADRTAGAPIDALAGVSVVAAGAPVTAGATRATDLLAAVPGVDVGLDGTDPSAVINVRGLQDFGRVAVTVDGARQNFRQSGHGTTGVFLPDPFLIGTATVVRGPIANVYGSGAIGGVVSFDTLAPGDVLDADERWAVESQASYETNGDGWKTGLAGAYRVSEAFDVLGALVYARNDTRDDGDGAPIVGSDNEIVSGLLKAEVRPSDFSTLTFGYLADEDAYVRDASTASTQSAYDTEAFGQTGTIKWRFADPDRPLYDVSASAYFTTLDKTETYVYGANAGRDRSFDVTTFGLDVANTARFETGAFAHALTIGLDAFADDVATADVAGGTGAVSTPSGERKAYGAFVQDEIRYGDWLRLTGALRFDGYDFTGEDADGNAVEGDGTRLSPKIALGLTPFEGTAARGLELYGSYSEGYRAPSITETLVSGPHPGFVFLPNPNLEPETAHNVELGVNFQRDDLLTAGDAFRLKAGWFHNEVEDFIDGRVVVDPSIGVGYQYQNVRSATIEGVELEASYDMGLAFFGLAASRIRGEDDETGAALGSIPADRIVSTAGLRFLDERLTVGAQWEAVFAQTRVPDGTPESEAYDLVNLFAAYDVNDDVSVGLNVKNLFDVQYTEYLTDDPSPGLSVMFTLNARLGG